MQMQQKSLAFVFPGQGSQQVGMLQSLADIYPVVQETFAEASAILGYDAWQLVQAGPAEQLNQTVYTQPILLTAGVAVWRAWLQAGGAQPSLLAGHSLGEYTALVCAGALSLAEGLKVVALRARLMQEAVPAGVGAMAAIIGLDAARLAAVCQAASTESSAVYLANLNAPLQIVLAGHQEAVQRAMALALEQGAKRAVPLAVSVPAHCPLMQTAAQALLPALQAVKWARPHIPVIHNVDVARHEEADSLQQALVQQLWQPVRWHETLLAMLEQGIEVILECGPGQVLTGLNKRVEGVARCASLATPEALQAECLQYA